MNEPKPGVEPERKKGSRGCFYCCLSSFFVILVLAVGGLFAGYWFVKGQVVKYTADTPAEIPVVEYSEEEVKEIQTRIDTFKEAIEEGEQPEDLVLTADEINALIAKDDDLKGRVYVSISDDQVSGEVSIPTDAVPGGDGRYFNASASFNVALDNGVLIVTLASAQVKDEEVPQEIIDAMSKENLAKDLYKNPEVAELISKFESLTVQENVIILTPRPVVSDAPAEVTDAVDEVAAETVPE